MAGHCFLRPETELTTRFCFVDFEGAPAMAALDAGAVVDRHFVVKFAPKIAKGMDRLKAFVKEYSQ